MSGCYVGCSAMAWAALAMSCGREPKSEPAAAAPGSTVAAPSGAPSGAPVPTQVWYAGTWSGTYESTLHRIELSAKQGGLPEWAADPGKDGVGQGTINVSFDSSGLADGKAEGALGEHRITGAADGDAIALRFLPAEPGRWSGTLVAGRGKDRVTGTLNAASGDGRAARVAAVTLTKVVR